MSKFKSVSEECETLKASNEQKLDSCKRATSRSTTYRSVRPNCTIPQPFTLATEKRASSGSRFCVTEASAGGINKTSTAISFSPNVKKNQAFSPRKTLQTDNARHLDEEDTSSAASSSAASVQASKMRTTMASAPVFRSAMRAEKRKEFYLKLEEKQAALEAERNHSEARTKEEYDAAIKQLRKSLTFKAMPMPSFYYEGSPSKLKLKKVPSLCAKSTKCPRKSFNDAISPHEGEDALASNQVRRYSTGSFSGNISNRNTSFDNKGPISARESSKHPSQDNAAEECRYCCAFMNDALSYVH